MSNKMQPPELVRLSPITLEAWRAHMAQKFTMDLQAELMVMRDLLQQLDPEHSYIFSPEYIAFLKTKLPEKPEEETLDRHKAESSLQVISLSDGMQKIKAIQPEKE
jgi:hypothetical protein